MRSGNNSTTKQIAKQFEDKSNTDSAKKTPKDYAPAIEKLAERYAVNALADSTGKVKNNVDFLKNKQNPQVQKIKKLRELVADENDDLHEDKEALNLIDNYDKDHPGTQKTTPTPKSSTSQPKSTPAPQNTQTSKTISKHGSAVNDAAAELHIIANQINQQLYGNIDDANKQYLTKVITWLNHITNDKQVDAPEAGLKKISSAFTTLLTNLEKTNSLRVRVIKKSLENAQKKHPLLSITTTTAKNKSVKINEEKNKIHLIDTTNNGRKVNQNNRNSNVNPSNDSDSDDENEEKNSEAVKRQEILKIARQTAFQPNDSELSKLTHPFFDVETTEKDIEVIYQKFVKAKKATENNINNSTLHPDSKQKYLKYLNDQQTKADALYNAAMQAAKKTSTNNTPTHTTSSSSSQSSSSASTTTTKNKHLTMPSSTNKPLTSSASQSASSSHEDEDHKDWSDDENFDESKNKPSPNDKNKSKTTTTQRTPDPITITTTSDSSSASSASKQTLVLPDFSAIVKTEASLVTRFRTEICGTVLPFFLTRTSGKNANKLGEIIDEITNYLDTAQQPSLKVLDQHLYSIQNTVADPNITINADNSELTTHNRIIEQLQTDIQAHLATQSKTQKTTSNKRQTVNEDENKDKIENVDDKEEITEEESKTNERKEQPRENKRSAHDAMPTELESFELKNRMKKHLLDNKNNVLNRSLQGGELDFFNAILKFNNFIGDIQNLYKHCNADILQAAKKGDVEAIEQLHHAKDEIEKLSRIQLPNFVLPNTNVTYSDTTSKTATAEDYFKIISGGTTFKDALTNTNTWLTTAKGHCAQLEAAIGDTIEKVDSKEIEPNKGRFLTEDYEVLNDHTAHNEWLKKMKVGIDSKAQTVIKAPTEFYDRIKTENLKDLRTTGRKIGYPKDPTNIRHQPIYDHNDTRVDKTSSFSLALRELPEKISAREMFIDYLKSHYLEKCYYYTESGKQGTRMTESEFENIIRNLPASMSKTDILRTLERDICVDEWGLTRGRINNSIADSVIDHINLRRTISFTVNGANVRIPSPEMFITMEELLTTAVTKGNLPFFIDIPAIDKYADKNCTPIGLAFCAACLAKITGLNSNTARPSIVIGAQTKEALKKAGYPEISDALIKAIESDKKVGVRILQAIEAKNAVNRPENIVKNMQAFTQDKTFDAKPLLSDSDESESVIRPKR